MKKKFIIEGLDCANCAAKFEDALNKIEGVDEASVSFISQKVTIVAEEDKLDAAVQQMFALKDKMFPEATITAK